MLSVLWGIYIGLGFGLFKPWAGKILKQPLSGRAEKDLSYQNMTIEELRSLEEREKDGTTGLSAVAAWRIAEAKTVRDGTSGKTAETGVVFVYGPLELAFPSRVMSGSLGQYLGKRECVLTETLSWNLFGSVDTQGCELIYADTAYRVAAVVERKESILFLPAWEGAAQRAAFAFQSGERLDEKMEALGFSSD